MSGLNRNAGLWLAAENSLGAEVYVSDDDDSFTPASSSRSQASGDTKME